MATQTVHRAVAMSTISISVQQCRNLRSPRADHLTCFARVEHGPRLLAESGRLEGEGGEELSLKLETSIQCTASDPHSLDEIAQNPLLVSLLEVLPKDKKAKEEKTAILGQACVDLLPLLHTTEQSPPSLKLTVKLLAEGSGTSPEEAAEVDVEVSTSQPLLREEHSTRSNLLTFRLRSLHSLPDSWQPPNFPYTFSLAMPLPSSSSSSPTSITLPQGILKCSPDKDPSVFSSHWKWPNLPGAVGGAALDLERPIQPCALEDEVGELNEKQDVKFRKSAECDKPRVVWNVERRCWLQPEANTSLLQLLSQCPLWPVEVGRWSVPSGGGKGKGKEEEPMLSFHGVAYVNLSPLLYPGATHISGAYSLHPYSETEVPKQLQREHASILVSAAETAAASVAAAKKTPGGKRTASAARLADASIVTPDRDGGGEGGEVKSEGCAYVEAGSYVFLEIELHKPLIPKRPPSVLAQRIAEYIPPRPALPRKVGGAERAVANYHSQTANIANTLLEEYRDLFGEELQNGALSDSKEATEERCHKLLFHLNSSGKYHAFKEQLKQAVVQIVREKFLSRAKTKDQADRQTFLSELYVFLTDQTHSGMKKVLSLEDSSPPPPSAVDCELLKHFAFEAEVCRDFELADRYYKERVSREDHAPSHWYDYGVFCLLVGDLDRSEQCFREAISRDQKMVPALLLYGMTCCLQERYSEAEQFFEMATTSDPGNIIAWTMRGLFYEHSGNGVYQDMCYQEANKLNSSHTQKTFVTPGGGAGQTPPVAGGAGQKAACSQSKASITSKQTGDLKQPSTSSVSHGEVPRVMVESSKSLSSGSSQKMGEGVTNIAEDSTPHPHPPLCTTLTTGAPTESAVSFSMVASVISEDNEGATPTQLKGEEAETSVRTSDPGDTEQRTELVQSSQQLSKLSATSLHSGDPPTAPPPPPPPSPPTSIFLQAASYLLDVHALKFAEMALAHELTHPEGGPSPLYHVAEGRLYIHREQYDKAQESLKKATTMDIQDANVWSLLGHTHFLMGDFPSARDCYERTVDYVTRPAHLHTVYLRLADIYLREQQYEKAKTTFLHACRTSPSSMMWRGMGIACYQLGDLTQSEDALCEANILNNLDPVVWAYLTMVCLKTERPVEAEQALKFAVKGGLKDPSLIAEIRELHQTLSPSTDLVHLHQLTVAT